jgi:hypothetical protein
MIKTVIMTLMLCLIVGCGGDGPVSPDPPLECPPGQVLDETVKPPICVDVPVEPPVEPPKDGPSCGDLKGSFCSHKGTCPEGYEAIQVTWDCNPCCRKTIGVTPQDYISLQRGESIINDVTVDSRSEIHVGIWGSVRNLQYAATHCADLIGPTFGITSGEMLALADEGQYLYDKFRNHWIKRLRTQNKHYPEYPEFENQSDVRKDYWQPFENRLRNQRAASSELHNIALRDPLRQTCEYDNTQGWCVCKNR